jgi:hypothetical protein
MDDELDVKQIDRVVDKLGHPIDIRIKPLVMAFWLRGIKTLASCEGHQDWGNPYPWIAFGDSSITSVAEFIREYHKATNGDEERVWCIVPGLDDNNHVVPFNRNVPLKTLQQSAIEWAKMGLRE